MLSNITQEILKNTGFSQLGATEKVRCGTDDGGAFPMIRSLFLRGADGF